MTLIDKDSDRLDRLSKEFDWMARIIKGDASSPVVLEEADLAGQSYVLALTGDDRVNLAVARFARKAGVSHIVALVHLAEYLPYFEELEVKTINVTQSVSNLIHGYLQDPRITITPVAHGGAELLEIEIGSQFELIGRRLNQVRHPNWNVGIVVVPLLGKALFEVLAKPLHVNLAHNLPCPLMVAKGSHPNKRILIPFNGSPASVTALEAALDIALQLDAEATVAIVKEPDFPHGTEEEGPWALGLIVQAREVALPCKRAVSEVIRTGNPVAEIAAMAGDFDLIVIGSPTDEKEFLEPHVGELLVRKSPCSALIITH